jgi:anti-sigma factor RsiW
MRREVPESDVHAFVDGQLDEETRARVAAYLDAHPEIARRVRQYALHKSAIVDAVRESDHEKRADTEMLAERLARRLAERSAPRPYRRRIAAVAAGLLLVAVGWTAWTVVDHVREAAIPDAVESAALAHHIFAEDRLRPVELPASAVREMAAWFSGHLGERIQIPNLAGVGLRLIGGRMLSNDEGPMAQLLYEDGKGRRLTLYLSPQAGEEVDDLEVVGLDDVNAGYWQEDDILYAIVANTAKEQIRLIAAELGAPTGRGRL